MELQFTLEYEEFITVQALQGFDVAALRESMDKHKFIMIRDAKDHTIHVINTSKVVYMTAVSHENEAQS